MMTLEGIKKFISLNDTDKGLFNLSIIPLGEALLNPEIFDIIEALHSAGYILDYIASNLALDLSDTQIDTLCLFDKIGINYATRNIDPTLIEKTYSNVLRLQTALDARAGKTLKICKVTHPEEPIAMPSEFLGSLVPQPMVMYNELFYNNITRGASYSEYLQRLGTDPTSYNLDTNLGAVYLPAVLAANPECFPTLNILPNGNFSSCLLATTEEDFKIGDAYSQSIRALVASQAFTDITELQRLKKFPLCEGCMTCSGKNTKEIQKAFE